MDRRRFLRLRSEPSETGPVRVRNHRGRLPEIPEGIGGTGSPGWSGCLDGRRFLRLRSEPSATGPVRARNHRGRLPKIPEGIGGTGSPGWSVRLDERRFLRLRSEPPETGPIRARVMSDFFLSRYVFVDQGFFPGFHFADELLFPRDQRIKNIGFLIEKIGYFILF